MSGGEPALTRESVRDAIGQIRCLKLQNILVLQNEEIFI